jgi:hypothetical protein
MDLESERRDYFSVFHELADAAYFRHMMLVSAVNNGARAEATRRCLRGGRTPERTRSASTTTPLLRLSSGPGRENLRFGPQIALSSDTTRSKRDMSVAEV